MTDSVIQPSYSSRLAEILIPPSLRSDDRSGRLYFWFVTCHLVAGLLALGLALWVYHEAHELLPSYWLFISLSASLLAQPVLFRFSGAYGLLSVMSVLILNAMVLVAVYNFGGYLSPALPVTVIIPLFCLLFLSNLGQIVGLSALAGGYGILITLFANGHEFPRYLDGTDLSGLFLAGVIVAAVGVAAVARAYLDLYAMSREVLRAEVARHKNTADNLAKARNLATHATRTKSQSIAAICDEIRMPLNAMIGFSQIISRELMGQLTDERYRTCASDIESSGRHLLGVVDEVLDLVRVQTGDLELIDTEFELADLIEKSCMATSILALARKVELVKQLPRGGLMIRADQSRMRQVIVALLSNCIALVGSGGRVQVQLSKTAAGEAMLLICSNGSTVSPERMALAMEPLDGLPSGQGIERLGIGYGLPIARRLVELHGGKLEVGGPKLDESHVILTLPAERLV